jgi:hypothetical protein
MYNITLQISVTFLRLTAWASSDRTSNGMSNGCSLVSSVSTRPNFHPA